MGGVVGAKGSERGKVNNDRSKDVVSWALWTSGRDLPTPRLILLGDLSALKASETPTG
jgi:hypothetical protein